MNLLQSAVLTCGVMSSLAIGQSPVSSPFGSAEESSTTVGYGFERSGDYAGAHYTYGLAPSGQVINGSIDGPASAPGFAMDDPDRWVITVDRDKMTDAVRWYIHHYQTGLMLRVNRAGKVLAVCIVGSDFPGRTGSVRVGTQRPIAVINDCSSQAGSLLQSQLTKGGRLLVRRYEWPYDFPQDKEGSADNFDKTMELFRFLIGKK